MDRAKGPRLGHIGARAPLAAIAFAVLLMAGTSCGSGDGSGPPKGPNAAAFWHGDFENVTAQLRLAEMKSNGRRSRATFCRQPWSGPGRSRRSAAKLLLDKAVVIPGRRMFAVLVNTGQAVLEYGVKPEVDELVHGLWHPRAFVQGGVPVGFPGVLLELTQHMTSTCLEVPVSDSWRPGLYRVWFKVESVGGQGAVSELQPTAYFRVSSVASRN